MRPSRWDIVRYQRFSADQSVRDCKSGIWSHSSIKTSKSVVVYYGQRVLRVRFCAQGVWEFYTTNDS